MKRFLAICGVAAVLGGMVFPAQASSAVEPASLTITNFRDEAVANVSAVEYYNGASLLFTNCVLFAGTDTNSSRQGLVDVAIQIKIGNATTCDTWTAASTSTAGVWSATVTVPAFAGYTYMQLKIMDVNTNVYIYPWRILNRKTPL